MPSVAKAPAAAPAHTEEAIKPTAATLAPIAPAAQAPAPEPTIYEVQSCSTECDYPCGEDCGQTWETCYVVQEYSGTYDLRLADENDTITGVLKRHVRRKGELQQQHKRLRSKVS